MMRLVAIGSCVFALTVMRVVIDELCCVTYCAFVDRICLMVMIY